ncbi:MAG: metallophosphoesterase [Myxococcota bacterium]
MRASNAWNWLALSTALLASPLASAAVTRGPYVQDVQKTSALVVWEGSGDPALTVGFGIASTAESSAAATCSGVHCSALLKGLTPDSVYRYQLLSAGTPLAPEGTVRLQPTVARPFTFAIYGDNRSDAVSHQTVVDGMLSVGGFEFVLNTGDMVSSGEVESQWDEFFAIEAELVRDVPLYPSVGNHEEDGGKAEILERLFHPPAQASGSKAETYYSFDWGNSHFIAIDGQIRVQPWWICIFLGKAYDKCLDLDQQAWLEADLKKAQANAAIDHVFVFMHEGPYSSKQGRTGSAGIRELLATFAASKVKLVISGHDHYYEHGISGNGLHYLISGGGGAPLYQTETDLLSALWPHQIHKSVSVHNFQVVTVSGSLIEVTSYDGTTHKELDAFIIGESPDCGVAIDCFDEQPGVCAGKWTCPNFTCVWECAPPPSCKQATDCPPPPAGTCPGHWECPFTEQCQWACDAVEECSADADCASKEPLNTCQGGHFACVTSVCEWACEGPVLPGPDAVEPGPDAAPDAAPDAGAEVDGAGAETGGPDAGAAEVTEAEAEADAGGDVAETAPDAAVETVDSSDATSLSETPGPGAADTAPEAPAVQTDAAGDSKSSGCAGGPPSPLAWAWLGLALLVSLRRRRPC